MAEARKHEVAIVAWSAAAFGLVLASYSAFRPVRDALVLDGDPDQIPWLFTATFVAVSVVSPAWSALVGRRERRRGGRGTARIYDTGRRRVLVGATYHVFAACEVVFFALVRAGVAPVVVGRVFYVWSAVFNLFAVDGRDLGAWIVKAVEQGTVGTYNAFGPAERTSMKQVLDACNAAAGGKATITWVDAAFLDAQKVEPWSELPMWFDAHGDFAGFGTMSNARATAAGLAFRPIGVTAADTLAWLASLPDDERAKVQSSGITREREAKVLAAWKARG